MKNSPFLLWATWVAVTSNVQLLQADPTPFVEGIEFDRPESYLVPGPWNGSINLTADEGPLVIRSGKTESSPWDEEGGIFVEATPIRFVLGAGNEMPLVQDGVFEIWPYRGPWVDPLFSINSANETAAFNGLNVSINAGTLKIDSSPVVTNASISQALGSVSDKIQIGNGSAGTGSVVIGFGNPSAGGGSVALGTGTATGLNSFASGLNTKALGKGSVAIGEGAEAWGLHSAAFGTSHAKAQWAFAASSGGVTTTGIAGTALSGGTVSSVFGFAAGGGTTAKAYSSVSLGIYNIERYGENLYEWAPLDSLFTVGNGSWTSGGPSRSNAITTLKNGSTTLSNRAWKAAVLASNSAVLEDPVDTNDSGGMALTVEGHTHFRGKVIIAHPQGDVSMGIFE